MANSITIINTIVNTIEGINAEDISVSIRAIIDEHDITYLDDDDTEDIYEV